METLGLTPPPPVRKIFLDYFSHGPLGWVSEKKYKIHDVKSILLNNSKGTDFIAGRDGSKNKNGADCQTWELKGELHPKPKLSMLSVLSQNINAVLKCNISIL